MIATLRRSVSTARRTAANRLAVLLVVVAALATGCTTQTVGMQAPVSHDYDGLEWRPLGDEVGQRIVVAPGYTALVENDPGTGPGDLGERIAGLPDDVRRSTLEELRIAIRLADDLAFDRKLAINVENLDRPDEALTLTLDDLQFDGDWAVITQLPTSSAGQTIEVKLSAAGGWEYGVANNRVPYGGYAVTIGPAGANRQQMGGALGFQTIFEQRTDVGEILSGSAGETVRAAVTDPVLTALYAIILTGVGVLWIARLRNREVA